MQKPQRAQRWHKGHKEETIPYFPSPNWRGSALRQAQGESGGDGNARRSLGVVGGEENHNLCPYNKHWHIHPMSNGVNRRSEDQILKELMSMRAHDQ
jgi:hypothetical protein